MYHQRDLERGQPFSPRRQRNDHSVRHLTCSFWAAGNCKYTAEACLYSHAWREQVAEAPKSVQPGMPHVAGKKWVLRSQDNAELRTDRLTSARLGLPAYRNWRAITFGEEAAKTPQPSGSWRQHAPPGRVANQTDFQPQFRQASTPGQIVGSPTLNPKATSFEPEHVRQLREQQEKIESLEILVRNQAKLIGEAAGDIDEMMGELYWASKDIKEVRDSLKTGQMNTAINIKKLDYRAMDLDGIISRQGNWKQALHTNMDEAMKALGLEDEERRPR